MAKRRKPDPIPEPGPNVFEGPVRVGRIIGGELVVDYPAEVRDGVLRHRVYNGRDEPTGWDAVPLHGAGWALTEASDADLTLVRGAGYDEIDDGRGHVVFDRKGLTPQGDATADDGSGDEAEAEPETSVAVEIEAAVAAANAEKLRRLAEENERLKSEKEHVNTYYDAMVKAELDYEVKAEAAKVAKAAYKAAAKAHRRASKELREGAPLFDNPPSAA